MPRRRVRDGLARSIGAALLLLSAAGPVAADHGVQPQTFAQVVGQSKLIVVTGIGLGPDGGIVLDVERVLKGMSAARLTYPPTAEAPPIEGWQRAVIAFHDPMTIDFRAPTIAWHIADDGAIDPEGFQQLPGLPPTLDAMVAAFGLDATEATTAADPATISPRQGSGEPVGIGVFAALAGAAAVIAAVVVLRRRSIFG